MRLYLTLSLLLLLPGLAAGQEQSAAADCLGCHTRSANEPIHAILQTPHGSIGDGGAGACIACHGNSVDHAMNPLDTAPDVSHGPRWPSSPERRNAVCVDCHDSGTALHWSGSEHQRVGLACDGCHQSHRQRDTALMKTGGQQVCLDCHTRVRSELLLPSRHPIAEGETACGDCHNPHGGLGQSGLHALSVNDSCQQCHEETRGPFLWEHAPVAEDCGLCHRPHGSVHDRLLTARGPALCQQCHVAAYHPSVPYGAGGLSGGNANRNLLGKNCLNCHSQVHGSNHPSGARLTR